VTLLPLPPSPALPCAVRRLGRRHRPGRARCRTIGSAVVLILLPPSEGKATAEAGPVVDLAGLSFPGLIAARERVIDALTALCADAERARAVLGLSAGQAGDLGRNRELRTAPALAVAELYTGVLYDNLGLRTLDAGARRRAERDLIVFSGLWGALRITDRVPPYRLSMAVRLPPLGGLAAFWRRELAGALGEPTGLVVDLRSANYAAAWRPAERSRQTRGDAVRRGAGPGAGARTAGEAGDGVGAPGCVVGVRVIKDGKVVSHMAKATRGAVARSLLEGGADPSTPEELAKILIDLGHVVRYESEPGAPPRTLDIVLSR
jgi:cytoplasmic iron level regulating protein YaaA (DUF328/UPF0246 family)